MAVLFAGACTAGEPGPAPRADHLEATRSALVEESQQISGTNNGDKVLILTFDDGPGPMEVTGELSGWLRDQGIHATFFVNGACIAATNLANNSACDEPIDGALEVLQKVTADGHLVGNHTTTHRSLTGENDAQDVIPRSEWVKDITETDDDIKSVVPWNKFFFRAPFGDFSSDVYDTLSDTPMAKYIGPVYWNAGGGPTDSTRAADWECWDPNAGLNYSTKKCGDLYLKEIRALGNGIVLMHDAKGNTDNHSLKSGVGNTADMVKYIVPILQSEGYTFKPLWEDVDVTPLMAKCDAACLECSGPSATECTKCPAGQFLNGSTCSAAPSNGAVNESIAGATSPVGTKTANGATPSSSAASGCSAAPSTTTSALSTCGLALAALLLVRRRRSS